jgi:hypothetical protein
MNPPWLQPAMPQPIGVGDTPGDEQVDAGEDVGPLLPADPAGFVWPVISTPRSMR